MFICLIFPKPIIRFRSRFFLLKTENTELALCYFRRLRYLQNKTGFRNRQVHIHADLKWSSQSQSGLGMPRQAPEWPGHPLRDQLGQLRSLRASQGMTGPVRSQSGHLKTTLVLRGALQVSMNMYLSIPEIRFVL